MGISVILPAYQEEQNLKEILPKLKDVLEKTVKSYEILVVDTLEPLDNTYEVCQLFSAKYINRRSGNSYGDAIRTGIEDSINEWIVVMDADGSHNPSDIRKLYKEARQNQYDLVIGSRYIKGGDSHNGFILRLMSHMVNLAYRIVFRLKVKDVSNSFRLYNGKKLKSIALECQNFDVVEEILIRLKVRYPELKIKEVPIYFSKRVYGESKRDLIKFIFSYIETMIKLIKIMKNEKRQISHG